MTRPTVMLLLTLSLGALCAPAFAQTDTNASDAELTEETLSPGLTAMAIDDGLRTSLVRVMSISGDAVLGEDERGRPVVLRRDELVALVRVSPRSDVRLGVGASEQDGGREWTFERLRERSRASTSGVLVTTDGRRYPGTLEAWEAVEGSAESEEDSASGDGVVWVRGSGPARFSFEEVSRVVSPAAPASVRLTLPGEVTSDTLYLSNGDVVEGFVARVDRSIALERDDGTVLELDANRVHAMVLANPPAPSEGALVWYDDGSIVGGGDVIAEDGRWIGISAGEEIDWKALTTVRAVVFDASRLVALSALHAEVEEASDRRVGLAVHEDDVLLEEAPALGAFDVLLDGPMTVRYVVPAEATRFATSAELLHPDSAWSDCDLVVRVDGAEVSRVTLSQSRAISALNVDLTGARTLELSVEEGRFGPVRDGVRLARPIILLGR